jgi:hypothetical protein
MSHVLSDVFGQPIVATIAGVGLVGSIGFLGAEAGFIDVSGNAAFAPAVIEGVKWGAVGAVPGILAGATKDVMGGENYDAYDPEPEVTRSRARASSRRESEDKEERDFREAIRARESDYLPEPERPELTRYKGERAASTGVDAQAYAEFQEFKRFRNQMRSGGAGASYGYDASAGMDAPHSAEHHAQQLPHIYGDAPAPTPVTTAMGATSSHQRGPMAEASLSR